MECIICGKWFSSTDETKKLCMTCERVLQHPSIGIAPERLLELSQAEKDGRLVVHGRWIKTYEDCDLCHECSLCEKSALLDGNEREVLSPWCPNCGAKMDVE